MTDFLIKYYLWFKSFHIIFVICWMAGLFYLPRLFVYHASTIPGSEISEQFLTMERRLIKIIMNPAMILTFVFGALLIFTPGIVSWHGGWLHCKFFLVFILAGLHGLCIMWYKDFVNGKRKLDHKFFRLVNELPVIIMVFIVIMVVVRPF